MTTGSTLYAEELTVSVLGGFFEETLAVEIYPGFTAETDIEIRSIAQPEDSTWMTQLMVANRAGQAPSDLSLVVDEVLFRGNEVGLWAELDPANMTGTDALINGYVKLNDAENAYAVGALAFYTTFVTNTDYKSYAPRKLANLWEPPWDGELGIVTTPNSDLLKATAFPSEGGIVSDAYWVVPAVSENVSAAEQFLDYMSRPAVQSEMARVMGIAPIVPHDSMDLTDEEFAAVSSDIEPIRVQTEIHLREGDWLETKYQEPRMSDLMISNLSKSFGTHVALRDISIDVTSGEFICLLGGSGCGKTTLLRLIAGLEAHDSGDILLDGSDLSLVPCHKRNIGMVFQSLALFPHLNVAGNVNGLRLCAH